MVGKLLARGMLAGIVAGLLTFGFAKTMGEPQVDQAISFGEKLDAAKGEAPEPELVSRRTQAGIGLFTGVMTYSAAMGGIFSLVFAFVYGRAGRLQARPLSALLALAAFVSIVIVPNIKYPASPPAVGDPETIGYRTGLFFLMVAISIAVMVFSLKARRRLAASMSEWNASIVAGLGFIVVIGVIQAVMPVIDEVPADFPAVVLWKFRTAAIGMQVILWTTIGLLFGALAERAMRVHGHAQAA
ncbi:membrane protein [Caballeronia novacaledonica]|uniref:Membrane protein n=1 Tax=Caballeronia novacaledonica TaxID=1544861 RepID=A0A2U3I2N1_9BURK|nr:CbtA family protein [Caballeronia novacaledonica]SPB14382.1 membrane protein [Caballeronia novacaledonica]